MFTETPISDKIELAEGKSRELELQIDVIHQKLEELYADLKITPEDLRACLENPDNFSPGEWTHLQSQLAQLDAKLKRDLDNIRNPLKNRKTYADRQVAQHWLFVR